MAFYTLTQANSVTFPVRHNGGLLQVQVSGEFGGATLRFYVENILPSPDLPETIELTDFALTEPDVLSTSRLSSGTQYYFLADGATGATDIKVTTL